MNSITSTDSNTDTESNMRYWRRRVFFTVWVTYMIYYVGRVNISIAITPMLLEYDHLTKTLMGGVTTALFIMYALGQFVNGQIGDVIGGRKLVTIGLVGSAAVNLLFGFTDGIVVAMMLLWAFNGIFQSMGWAPSVKTVSNWVEPEQRGRWSSFLGSSYQAGGIVSWVIASLIIDVLGMDWRYSFWIAGLILFLAATHFYWRARSSPAEVNLSVPEDAASGKSDLVKVENDTYLGLKNTMKIIVSNKNVWYAAFGLFCLNIIRYGFTDWLPTYINTDDVLITFTKKILFPLAGSIGGISAVYISDRYLRGRRMPITAALFVLLAVAIWMFSLVPADDVYIAMIFISLIGFLTFAPHVILVTTMPMEFSDRKTTSSATGFIDGWGYIGAAFTGIGSGWILDATGDNWSFLFVIWALVALLAFSVLVLNRDGEKSKS